MKFIWEKRAFECYAYYGRVVHVTTVSLRPHRVTITRSSCLGRQPGKADKFGKAASGHFACKHITRGPAQS
eukprot:scaffold43699_cov80-Phaeocystis_antarctica.AAC.4